MTKTVLQPVSLSFFVLYTFGVGQMIIANYFPDLLSPLVSSTFSLWDSTVIKTLVVIYLIATVIGLRKLFHKPAKLA